MGCILFLLHIPPPKPEKLTGWAQINRYDPIGVLLFAPSIVSLVLALQWGGSTYPWSAPKIIGLLVTFAVLFVVFMIYEVMTPKTAMVPHKVLMNRSIAGCMLYIFLLYGAMISIIYFLTIWFQAAKGYTAQHSGFATIPLVLSLVVLSILSATVTQKIRYYNPALLLSPVLCAIGSGLLSTLTPASNHQAWIGYQILYGFGIGAGLQTSNLPAQNVLARQDVPTGMAMQFFMMQLGGSIFLAVSQNIFTSRLVGKLAGTAGLDPQIVVNTGATELRKVVPASQLETVVDAYNYSLTRVFILTAALSACLIIGALPVEWKPLRGKAPEKEGKDGEKGKETEEQVEEKAEEKEVEKEQKKVEEESGEKATPREST